MLNFRKLRQDFAPAVLKEGKSLFDKNKILEAKILRLDQEVIRFGSRILGSFDNAYESEIEIDRFESQTVHTNCDCPSRYDCQHLAALIFFLEEKMDRLLVEYSQASHLGIEEQAEWLQKVKEAQDKEEIRQDARMQKLTLQEYATASEVLATSPFFLGKEETRLTQAELGILFHPQGFSQQDKKGRIELQVALRLPFRSKPLQISHLRTFLQAIRYEEPLVVAGRRILLSLESFSKEGRALLVLLLTRLRFMEQSQSERTFRLGYLDLEATGELLGLAYRLAVDLQLPCGFQTAEEECLTLPCLYLGTLETPLRYDPSPCTMRFCLDYIEPPGAKLLVNPKVVIGEAELGTSEAFFFPCAEPGLVHQDVYYRLAPGVKRSHLLALPQIRNMTIPEPLFGTFVEHALPQLRHYAEIANAEVLDRFVTLPHADKLKARCHLSYLDGELEASLLFCYGTVEVQAVATELTFEQMSAFTKESGILARDLAEEKRWIEELFQDFLFQPQSASFVTRSEKKIVEFMTGTIPRMQDRIQFECPQNLLDQFIYNATQFTLKLNVSSLPGHYEMHLKVKGALKGVKLDLLWECIAAKRSYVELDAVKVKSGVRSSESTGRFSKILVLDLPTMSRVAQLFDELGVKKLDDGVEKRPLWNLATIEETSFEGLPIQISISQALKDLRLDMLGEAPFTPSPIPSEVRADLRSYQKEGVAWLERLRKMYLNGILADDMGLGKTLQAVIALTQFMNAQSGPITNLIVCPTSLLYNWQEELHKFTPHLRVSVIDGIPQQRRKILALINEYDVLITSYTLLQKDIEQMSSLNFGYLILDEAQHIKNRGTRNAKSVKMIQAVHRLILTGTPIENALEELWSLMDFLMPGFLGSYERFVEQYIRVSRESHTQNMEYLKRKVAPFILRRMKEDVLKDLPPVSEIVYHCQLSKEQQELYRSYAQSARDELVKLVEKEGFDKVQIHVLATLTRLKQICCHPAIFAKEQAEHGDSAKYDLLLELLQTLFEGGHKTVIFSQYTKMLQIMREDFSKKGIAFSYLDGSTKNRLEIVKEFNTNPKIPVFLVSLKAGGTGLNLVGADTVIHYDMWWNPAVEAQATDRVHRLGQTSAVSSYKLVTLNTIEEKIVAMQKRKKGLVKKVVSCDDEAIAKLSWEDVLELLQA
jgi:superfamily II DNA or RNA helicase